MKRLRKWSLRVREIVGILCGGIATLVTVATLIAVILTSRLLIFLVKLACLPLIVLASLIYPDERNFALRERVVEDVRDWWRIMQPEW
mgnify:CR=1 FL=1